MAERRQASIVRILQRIEVVLHESGMLVGQSLRLLAFPCRDAKNVAVFPQRKFGEMFTDFLAG
jgi:hypothetical protein